MDAVLYESANGIGTVTLNRPDNRNSMTAELLEAFGHAVEQARADTSARCIIITGNGNCFSAGADLRAQLQTGAANLRPHERSYAMYRPFLSVLDIEVPVIGALNGHAVGGGFGLSLVCDIRIANESAKYGANFTKLGFHPGMAVSYLLPRLIGVSQAAELLFTGELILGSRMAELGLASRAVPAAEVRPAARQVAEAIAANAPIAVRMTKRSLYEGLEWQVRTAAHREAFAQASTLETADADEGMKALLEKRAPQFSGH